MGTFPNFSNIAAHVRTTLDSRVNNPYEVSKLNAWVRVVSGVSGGQGDGLVLYSNPNMSLFKAAGDNAPASIYGTTSQAGAIGTTWGGSAVTPSPGVGLRPSPIIESIEIDEGSGNLSRKGNFSIKCFSKEQMEIVTQYFLEPGFTVFIEFGWNTPNGARGLTTGLSATSVGQYQNFATVDSKRVSTNGHYDNYLGFITGGSVDVNGEIWTVNVKLTGYVELPAYLVNGDNGGAEQQADAQELIEKTAKENEYGNLSSEADLNKKRWMFAYNALPSNRKTIQIKSLETVIDDSLRKVPMAQAVNYINFDETVRDKMNAKGDGTMLSRALGSGGATQGSGDGRLAVPGGTELISSEKFIRFGALMKIFNRTIAEAYKIGNVDVKLMIDSSNSICGAYKNIFSTRKDKLFIPNPQTPKFDFIAAQSSKEPITTIPTDTTNNSVSYGGVSIQFPNPSSITDGNTNLGSVCYSDSTTSSMGITKNADEWGFLDDLYVNFAFASEILSTSNLNVKDALYQILNGMSSAVNDLWNFQIQSIPLPAGNTYGLPAGTQMLSIVDLNLTYKDEGEAPYTFNLIGSNSIFKDASFNMEMSGMKMNQVIGNRLGNQMGTETQPFIGKLFSVGNTDLVLQELRKSDTSGGTTSTTQTETDAELKEKNYANFLGKLGSYPKVELEKNDIPNGYDINKVAYVDVYDDAQLLKVAKSNGLVSEVSPLLPIRFSFTINGVSGIKRGDKFKVNGIPSMYDNGFFQVLSVKHTISGMQWNTEIEGGFRNNT
jgi:hypothetical protein